ncbi:cobalamin biosynthesis protein CobW [Acrocarpospora phusangensis]|uniref:Cobalamin biosynthesis protein CobW n=1 Tax=Acrocarpospora phusangensis TaxID=1070424 RepID=A0A919UJ81_9ACTN|nr:GTP-binding protein [Acrocarpospora phusangensis]GIH23536.1 cobalamin biosynthesis protein CobW [Acrocarpospora phusangensis]
MSVPVVLVSGLHAEARSALVARLLAEHPGSVAIHHDLRDVTTGGVERVVRDTTGVLDREQIRLAHGCVTCTVREDLIPELLSRAATAPLLIAELWDSVEPRTVAEALAGNAATVHALRLTGVLTAVDAEGLTEDLCRDQRLAACGKQAAAGDDRYLAEVLARQIEYATAIIVSGIDEEDVELALAVLQHLAPASPADVLAPPEVTGAAVDVEMLAARVDPATAQLPCDARTGDVVTVVWHRLRPLHPQRLFDAIDELVTQTVRSRGRFWLANRPDRLLAWDAVAGVISIEDSGPWLAALPEAAWEMEPPARRISAALDWNDIIGDRVQHLAFTGPDLDRDQIHALLDSCLLTEEEAMAGSDVWTGYDDPFAFVLDLKEIPA